jgi:hypothetical protein
MVTSPGGTSAAAIHELESGRLRTVLSEAVWASYRRTVELGADLEKDLGLNEGQAQGSAERPSGNGAAGNAPAGNGAAGNTPAGNGAAGNGSRSGASTVRRSGR